ncbi:30S ribosomal protein S18 [Leptospirillum ferriphilum]|uniref:Small ribosomal subunit protein bS18 n=4 Tax=Leptospirillum TaxID=179 RepID=A0A059XZS1_9BACT|nr:MULTISPECIES: 30S ribosomal protein S18 [Leptospirillum]EAY55981.1 MAG: ribosomal protein S18 [Leptospirillum rubarum]EDZ39124.1 MAG: Ribosomal protein S18 [Leptospirillum sp. Group II '5-way CG']EIJ76269.1 MAG: Ribosomal protein S18 [Leptospirillum sp. Group II 'C75']MCL4405696.1 30S ribosomal protein S18 [Bacillota bacterium]AFS53816.1 ribosomal protein S18 [Leptospirillum ferriphilum ML-04]
MSSPARSFQRKKVCRFCIEKLEIDYKDINTMKGFLTERGKIIPRRLSGTCSRHQRGLAAAIKQGRNVAFFAFSEEK